MLYTMIIALTVMQSFPKHQTCMGWNSSFLFLQTAYITWCHSKVQQQFIHVWNCTFSIACFSTAHSQYSCTRAPYCTIQTCTLWQPACKKYNTITRKIIKWGEALLCVSQKYNDSWFIARFLSDLKIKLRLDHQVAYDLLLYCTMRRKLLSHWLLVIRM